MIEKVKRIWRKTYISTYPILGPMHAARVMTVGPKVLTGLVVGSLARREKDVPLEERLDGSIHTKIEDHSWSHLQKALTLFFSPTAEEVIRGYDPRLNVHLMEAHEVVRYLADNPGLIDMLEHHANAREQENPLATVQRRLG
jgi:hypothetical protein